MNKHFCVICRCQNDYWTSRCPACGALMAMQPFVSRAAAPPPPPPTVEPPREEEEVPTFDLIKAYEGTRMSTGIDGLNRVLGTSYKTQKSGLHLPSVVLFGGSPGSGKSTLLLTMCCFCESDRVLYVSSEQTLPEIKANAERVGLDGQLHRVRAWNTTDVREALRKIARVDPQVLIIDSLSKMRDPESRVRDHKQLAVDIAGLLIKEAVGHGRGIILISHLNKDGEVTGFRELEHDVHAVMMLERRGPTRRMLHCPEKNRFGTVGEVAWFKMLPDSFEEFDPRDEVPEPKADAQRRAGQAHDAGASSAWDAAREGGAGDIPPWE